jgi:phosphoglycolate phosphatase
MAGLAMDLIFDLDGTLVDSRPGIQASLEQAVRQVFPKINTHALDFTIGPQIRDIIHNTLGQLTELEMSALESAFRASYDSEGWKNTQIYPGVYETLVALVKRVKNLYIITNKPQLPTSRLLAQVGLTKYFCDVLSPDSRQPKFANKAAILRFLLKKHSIPVEYACYVGDSEEDLVAAQICGISFIGIEYGYGNFHSRGNLPQTLKSFPEILSRIEFKDGFGT